MILQRVTQKLRNRDWSALFLELVVLVLGIFLGFQLDRWYERKQFASQEQGFLVALQADFAGTSQELERADNRLTETVDATKNLIALSMADSPEVQPEDFYRLLSQSSRLTSINYVSRTYDSLVASGGIEAIRNDELRAEMASFYSRVRGQDTGRLSRQYLFKQNHFDPFISRELDQVAMMLASHPDEGAGLTFTLSDDQHIAALAMPEFNAILATKWHAAYDLRSEARSQLAQSVRIQELIAASLGSVPSSSTPVRVRDE